ncbi:DUF934 domain-containing protein [Motiliproteus sp.]|uniref:DUF934 domain-containing protein n=1 Tax=Motiliproteus sp. TaxID=1898955 RepID=UPI003BAD2EC8
MPRIIKDGGIVDDSARIIEMDEDTLIPPTAQQLVFLPLSRWLAMQASVEMPEGKKLVGVWFDGEADIAALIDHLDRLPAIAIRFNSFQDGTGFSLGALLRESHGYGGELRAFGQLIADQAPQLRRCGFNAIALQPGESLETAMSMLEGMNLSYQGSIYSPRTPFKFRFPSASNSVNKI